MKYLLGLVVTGLLTLVTSVYADEVKQVLNGFLSFMFNIPPTDIGYYIVLTAFTIAFIYFVGIFLWNAIKWLKLKGIFRFMGKPIKRIVEEKPEYIFNQFNESFKALKEATEPAVKVTMFNEFQPQLHRLCYNLNLNWSDGVKNRIQEVLDWIPKNLSIDPYIDYYALYINMIINPRRSEHTIDMVKEKFLVELETLYNNPDQIRKTEADIQVLVILQKLHGHSEDYIMKLVDDAMHWSRLRFEYLSPNIDFCELKSRNKEAYDRVLRYLRRRWDEAEKYKDKDEETCNRWHTLYSQAKRC